MPHTGFDAPIFAAADRVQAKLREPFAKDDGWAFAAHVDFTTRDNGGEAFFVRVAVPWKNKDDNLDVIVRSLHAGQPPGVDVRDTEQVWVGCGTDGVVTKGNVGNAACVVKGRRVTLVTTQVTTFDLDAGDEVVDFVFTVRDSGTTYGYIETNKYVYSEAPLRRVKRDVADTVDVRYWHCFGNNDVLDAAATNVKHKTPLARAE